MCRKAYSRKYWIKICKWIYWEWYVRYHLDGYVALAWFQGWNSGILWFHNWVINRNVEMLRTCKSNVGDQQKRVDKFMWCLNIEIYDWKVKRIIYDEAWFEKTCGQMIIANAMRRFRHKDDDLTFSDGEVERGRPYSGKDGKLFLSFYSGSNKGRKKIMVALVHKIVVTDF